MDPTGGYEDAFIARAYDHVGPYRERNDVPFYVEMAQQAQGPVLELGCGTGRLLIPCARAGVTIIGLDLSARMLTACREKLAHESAEVQARAALVEGDMRHFDLPGPYALITVPFRAFQHLLTTADQLACLRAIREHLAGDGFLVLDLFNPSLPALVDEARAQEWGDEPEFELPDGARVLRRMRNPRRDLATQTLKAELIYYVTYPDGRTERIVQAFDLRYLFRYEVEHLLARSGFRVAEVYSDYDRKPFGAIYPGDLIVVAAPD